MQNKKIYTPAKGAVFGNKKAQTYGECLNKLETKHGNLTPDLVIKEAKAKKSPIHDYFDWNDTSAARKHRKWQARQLISTIKVEYIHDDRTITTKQFHNVTIERGESAYVSLQVAMTNIDYREQIINTALKEVKAWRARYKEYKELGDIFSAIDRTAA